MDCFCLCYVKACKHIEYKALNINAYSGWQVGFLVKSTLSISRYGEGYVMMWGYFNSKG